MTSLVPKILSGTLKGLNNKQSLRDIIISGNQDNFRFLVEDILESGGDVNDAIDEIKKINRYNNKIYLDLLADTAFEKAENISRYAEVFISMVENGLIDKDNEKISKWGEIAFKKAEYNSDFAKIFISMLEKCLIDKDNENISRLGEIAFKKAEHDLDYAKIYISMLEKGLIDKDNENISKLGEIAFKKAENDSDYAEVLISMLDKGLIDKDNENISKWGNIAIEKSENSLRYAKIYISMVENGLIEKDNEKISILGEIAFEKLRYAELLISMLEKGLIDKDNENISRLGGIAFKKAENDSDYADIYILMLEKGLIKKDNENISRLGEISFKKSENSLGYAKIYISMLDKELIKKDNENISKWGNIAIEGAEGNPVYAKIFISMLEKGLIEKDNENISRLGEIAFKKAENSLGYAKIFISMLEKGLIDKDNENISKWGDIAIEKAENDSDYAKMFISMLEKGLIDKDNEKIYIDEYKEIEESLLSVENNKIKLFNFLNKNIFNYDLLQEIKDFLKNENYFKIDKDFFINNIEKITKNKNGIYFGYFVESIKNGKKIEEKDVLTFPITLANFTDYVDDENEALFHLEKDSGVKFKGIKAWTKAWFLEDESRKNYLTKKGYDYLIKKSVNLSKEEKQEYLSKKGLDKLPKGEKYPKKMIEKYVNVKIDDLIKFNIISNNTENVIYNFLSKNIESFDKIIEFIFTEIKDSKHNTFVFTENKIKASRQFNYIFKYFLENKQKQIVSFLQKLSFIEEYDIGVNITKLKTLDDFKDKTGDLEVEKLRTNYIKILDIISAKSKDKKIKQLENAIKRKDEKGLEKLLAENMIDYFDYIFHKKMKIKIVSDFKNILGDTQIDFSEIDISKFDNPNFIEAYKMMIGTEDNKRQISKLLVDYLVGKFDKLEELNQYNSRENKDWLENNLTLEQQKIWLGENKKLIDLEVGNIEERKEILEGNIEEQIQDHFEISIKKIKGINELGFEFKTDFKNKGELKKEFNNVIKREKNSIKDKDKDNLFEDLKLQIDSIIKLERSKNQKRKKSNHIIISKELDPLKTLMMGNWVDGSCLSFYSSVGNYYSAIANTIDVNKGVYYIRNENGTLLGRVLVGIDSNKKLMRFKMYYSGQTDIDLNKHFNDYFLEIAENMGLEINGDEDSLEKIDSDDWYPDGTVDI